MKQLRIGFADTYENAILFFEDVLSRRYDIIRDDDYPEYLIFGDSNFGNDHNLPDYRDSKKIFFTGENVRPDFSDCDVALTFDHENSFRHYRLPLYVLEMWAINKDNNSSGQFSFDYLIKKPDIRDLNPFLQWKMAFIQTNPHQQFRNAIAANLDSVGLLASGGPFMNNLPLVPRNRDAKFQFYGKYLFGSAMENGTYPGYVTEKLLDCYYSNTIPIYWGSPTVARDFNPYSFIDLSIFPYSETGANDASQVLLAVMEDLTSHPKDAIQMLNEPAFNNNVLPDVANLDNFLDWWDKFVV